MNPLSALIGGAFSLFGGAMNNSSQQAINTQNLQAAEYINTGQNLGQYYKNMVSAAQGAGLSPLAVLGQRGPDAGFQAGSGSPGAGVQQLGRDIAAVDPHADTLQSLQEEKLRVDIANSRQLGNNAAIEGARNSWALEQLQRFSVTHPDWAPEGVQAPTLVGTGADWLNNLNRGLSDAGATFHNFMGRVPESVWNTP